MRAAGFLLILAGALWAAPSHAWTDEPPPEPPAPPEAPAPPDCPPFPPPSPDDCDPPPPDRAPPPPRLEEVIRADPCPPPCDPCRRARRRWEIGIEGTYLWAKDPEGTVGEPLPPGTPALDWGENEYDLELGGRFTVRFAPSDRMAIEARGAWYGSWEAESAQTGSFGASPPPGGASPSFPAVLHNEAQACGAEVTVWRTSCPPECVRWGVGVGVRFIRFEEEARMEGPVFAGQALVESNAENLWFLGQVAGEVLWTGGPIDFSLCGKAFAGVVNRDLVVRDTDVLSGGPHSASDEEAAFGWGFEVEAAARLRLGRCVAVSAGYTFLFLGEAVRAHDAMDFSDASSGAVQARQKTDDLWIHGFTLGLHVSF